jgi:guanylate kinase
MKFYRKIKRIILVGRGGSGKDHLRKILEGKGFKYAVSHTTRPKREVEENGKDYWFISSSELLEMTDKFYEGVYFNDWFYGTSLEEFNSSDLFIMTPIGISKLKPEDRKDSFIVYLNIGAEIIKERLLKRADSDSADRRIKSDDFDFQDFKDFDYEINDPNFTFDSLEFLTKN